MVVSKIVILLFWFSTLVVHPSASSSWLNLYDWHDSASSNESQLAGFELPPQLGFSSVTSTDDCEEKSRPSTVAGSLKLHLRHRSAASGSKAGKNRKELLLDSAGKDLARFQTLFRRITERKIDSTHKLSYSELKMNATAAAAAVTPELSGKLMATLESGVTLGSGEYFIDVYIGTPPRHFSLILDTGSDLNWIQCLPCHDCFEQHGPHYDPAASSSFRHVSCSDARCGLVSSPDGIPRRCKLRNETCDYYYWYGDKSNTTGDLSLETFSVNLTHSSEPHRVNGVVFGCGHWNRGLFHGAAGLLGLGRGPLSFSSQLRSLYGQTFSYCFVDRNSDLSVSSKLIFGEDRALLSHPELNYTSFANSGNETDTFYYVSVKAVVVGGEVLDIPIQTWELSENGTGGTIIDSGTTLSYFSDSAYRAIVEAFTKRVKDYPVVEDFPPLKPCYNVSGVDKVRLPELAIVFADGAVWNFPVENYFIKLEPEEIMCLAILGTPRSSLSILGNYQQQNFHISYDTKNSRLGFAPMKCAEI